MKILQQSENLLLHPLHLNKRRKRKKENQGGRTTKGGGTNMVIAHGLVEIVGLVTAGKVVTVATQMTGDIGEERWEWMNGIGITYSLNGKMKRHGMGGARTNTPARLHLLGDGAGMIRGEEGRGREGVKGSGEGHRKNLKRILDGQGTIPDFR